MTLRDPKGYVRQFINYFTFVTDSDWSSEQPVSDFFSYCPKYSFEYNTAYTGTTMLLRLEKFG